MKKAFGPCTNKIMPLKSASGTIMKDRSKQMDRWAEYFQELYSRENIATDSAVEGTVNLPVIVEHDIPPSVEELSKAIDSLVCGRVPGKGAIPPNVIKAAKSQFSSTTCTSCYCSARKKGMCPTRPATPTSSLCRRTRVTAKTATTTVESHSSVLLGKSLPA